MNAAAIVYTSQTGFTARYAALLAERTGLPCRPLKEAAALPRGTAVIYLGWLCAGGIKGLKGARRRFRTAAVCAVGCVFCRRGLASLAATQNGRET